MIAGTDSTAIDAAPVANDVARTLQRYLDARESGLRVAACERISGGFETFIFGVRIELQEYRRVGDHGSREPGTAPAGSSHICLRVDDLAGTLARAEAAGGRRVTDPFQIDSGINDGGAAVYLRDPDGYTIELFQAPP